MKKNRRRDTLLYYLLSSAAFLIVLYWLLHTNTIIFYFIAFMVAVFDTYFLEGTYDVYRLSRMKVLIAWSGRSLLYTVLFVLFVPNENDFNFQLFLEVFCKILFLIASIKIIFLTWSAHRLKNNAIYYNTILIGDREKVDSILKNFKPLGQKLIGLISNEKSTTIPSLGTISDLHNIIQQQNIEEVILAFKNESSHTLTEVLTSIRSNFDQILIRITPESYDYLMGTIKLDALYADPLIEMPSGKLKNWQVLIKRSMDIIISGLLLLLLAPVIVWIVIKTKFSSKGAIIYSQERIGKHNKPFKIFKFRSMIENAESAIPLLSDEGDPRCTPWGRFMRTWRLDEIPQFVNVLMGDMSLVGPRPERQYFIDEIKKQAPYYPRILTVLPGITSWGQVKFGYASNTDQMVQRLKFDLIYVENQSLSLDIKIILYTILVLFQGKGK